MFVNESHHRKRAAWLSLFAMMMAFIAPIVSQSLMRHEYTPAAHSQHHHSHTGTPHADSIQHPHSAPMADHAACGYCALFAHSPVIAAAGLKTLTARVIPTGRERDAVFSTPTNRARYHPQRPRAPPAIDIPQQSR